MNKPHQVLVSPPGMPQQPPGPHRRWASLLLVVQVPLLVATVADLVLGSWTMLLGGLDAVPFLAVSAADGALLALLLTALVRARWRAAAGDLTSLRMTSLWTAAFALVWLVRLPLGRLTDLGVGIVVPHPTLVLATWAPLAFPALLLLAVLGVAYVVTAVGTALAADRGQG
jgi:hypothetical protein